MFSNKAQGRASTTIAGFSIATASRRELVEMAKQDAMKFRADPATYVSQLVFDANGHALSLRASDQSYRAAVDQATLIHADGGFLVALSWLRGPRIQERSATTDMLHDFASATELSFYLLGGTEAVNAGCAARLRELYPNLKIVGRRNGYFTEHDENDIVNDINNASPDILWVGLGKPKEQVFAVKHHKNMKAGWIITCGGCFNYVTGAYGRAPTWMQNSGLEWIYRALTDKRLMWRYITTTPHALWLSLRR